MCLINFYVCFQDGINLLTDGGVKRQIVGQAELIPCVAARILWADRLAGRPVLHFLDNEASKFALIKGSSPTRDSAWIIHRTWELEASLKSWSWFERVPSASNCADAPSRGLPPKFELVSGWCKERLLPRGFEEDLVDRWVNFSRGLDCCVE